MKEIGMIYQLIRSAEGEMRVTDSKMKELIDDHEVTEIMINSHDQIFYEKGGRVHRAVDIFETPGEYKFFIDRLLSENNVIVNETRPIVEFSIGRELRVSIIKDSISHQETVITIRRKRKMLLSAERLLQEGLCDRLVMEYLLSSVKKKINIFISGQTSSGKTTLLNALIKEIEPSERLVVIEDTPEISLSAEQNAVSLISRKQRFESQEVSVSDLIKASLRMRPDRIILGEIRREEAVQFIHALNTGHNGSICTGHSQSNQDMFNRLLMLMVESGIPLHAAKYQLARSVDIMVHLNRVEGKRIIDGIETVDLKGKEVRFKKVIAIDWRSREYVWNDYQDSH